MSEPPYDRPTGPGHTPEDAGSHGGGQGHPPFDRPPPPPGPSSGYPPPPPSYEAPGDAGHSSPSYPSSGPLPPPYPPYGPGQQYGPGHRGPRPGSDDTTMAMLAHLLGLLTSFVGPLVLYLVKKDESPYVRDQAAEALNFQITLFIAFAVSAVLTLVIIGVLLMLIVWAGSLILMIMAAVAANRGENYRYPLNIRFVS
ncbi:hypothetical protein Sme01_16440 [Sphaerisporangium melleum]|uniref:DUF4870 domain-containing protein n=1 Tax=Sphaerisporangium melleum TaxID=321316 RepID=A0A917VUF8_9ACTN|nr:DUF4870 domain-containing protein [Sphaerisporangium melleum]GGL15136.1 hypothetical protein GCM10007964_66420 [Sphaerisporangium melleum]GII69168.1 hypothetical protein Sme01_16440 [Sphaerisporangium melleum]